MNASPLVSIIIPTFNRAQKISVALNSVIQQSYTHWECLVIDDGSDDATNVLLKDYENTDKRIRYYEREREPKGAPTCRNIGLHNAKGEYVIFLDSDDYFLPFCLEQRINRFSKYPDCSFIVFSMAEKRGEVVLKKEIPREKDYLKLFLSANLPWSIMCPIWKRSFLVQLHGFTEGYPRFNDPEIMIRALIMKDVCYHVFFEDPFDSVYIPSTKTTSLFLPKVCKSLKLFIPDMRKALIATHNWDYIPYLVYYLHLWFTYFYIPSRQKRPWSSISLILLFNKVGIISFLKTTNLLLRLMLYSGSTLVLKTPINKLTVKSLYYKPQYDT